MNQDLLEIKAYLAKTENCVATTAQTLTAASTITLPTGYTWSQINYILLQVDNQAASPVANCVRYTEDGTTPSDTVGKKLSDTQFVDISGVSNCSKFKMIKTTAAAGDTVVVQIAFYR